MLYKNKNKFRLFTLSKYVKDIDFKKGKFQMPIHKTFMAINKLI